MKVERAQHDPNLEMHTRAHTLSHSRTGSALLIVIGTLALISVFAVVYLSIGRTDRRTANAIKSLKNEKDTSTNFADYFGSVIGQDRLDAFVQYDGTGNAFGRREVTDAPYTDWTRRSELGGPVTDIGLLFTPTGGPFVMGSLNANSDFRVASDPWLASTTPVYLGQQGNLNADRPFSKYAPFVLAFPNAKNFLDNRDWLQISNFAPDGRFVNLFNLRSNTARGFSNSSVNGDEFGSFFAEPGVGYSVGTDGREIRRMSNYLSLWRLDDPNVASSMIKTFDPTSFGNAVWVPGQNTPVSLPGVTDVFNTPAVWTMYQRFMYMPINQAFITINRNDQVSTWADPDYPEYQYADANGDGMADSRWFELTAARDTNEGGNNTDPRDDVEVLYNNDTYRYFIAARAVDLSSMVNVNTATDLLVAPTTEFPLGLTPADVDLRRLLTMQDQASDYTAFNNGLPLSYRELHRPFRRDSENEPMWGIWTDGRAARNYSRNVSDYLLYQHDFEYDAADLVNTSMVAAEGKDIRQLESETPAMLIGRFAYDALRQGLTLGSALSDDYVGFTNTPSTLRQHLREYERDPSSPTGDIFRQINPEQRIDQYRAVAQLDPTKLGTSWARNSEYGSGLYGLEDLTELLTFHGLNDPEVTSRLERVTSGRYQSDSGDELQSLRLGPLMSNRSLALARDQHGYAVDDLAQDNFTQRPDVSYPNFRSVNGQISQNSMAQLALSPRNKMTTVSGAVPLVSSELIVDPSVFQALTLASTPAPLWTDPNSLQASVFTSPKELFNLYASALAGELDSNNDFWPPAIMDFQDNIDSTLFYGHRGPELALRIAAHMAVNMKDLTDFDGDPTVATLIADSNRGAAVRSYFAPFGSTPNIDPNNVNYQMFPGGASGNLFDLDPEPTLPANARLANGDLLGNRQVVNVYGFEAMPVLTEVSVLYAFTDDSDQLEAGGDPDYGDESTQPVVNAGGVVRYPLLDDPGDLGKITINGELSQSNSDFLIQVLAFQLHNPYDQPISLGGSGLVDRAPLTRQREFSDSDVIDTNANYQFDYYIEFAGRFYKIANYIEWYPTDQNTENYYALDSPITTTAFGTQVNPVDSYALGSDGGIMEPGAAGFTDFISRNVVLAAGETRVFYVIADKRFDDANNSPTTKGPDGRWTKSLTAWGKLPNGFTDTSFNNDRDGDSLPDGPYGDRNGWTGPAEQWVEHQFKVRGHQKPVMMMEFDPRDGYLLNETAGVGALEDPTAVAPSPLFANRNDNEEVRLWKKIVTTGEETDNPSLPSTTLRNLIENDMLVDRMELDPALNTTGFGPLHMTFNGGGNVDMADTISYKEDFDTNQNGADIRNDNVGITVARWKTQRRADGVPVIDPIDGIQAPSVGEIVPWMLRSRKSPALTRTFHETFLIETPEATEIFDALGGDISEPATAVTIKDDFEIHHTLFEFFRTSSNSAGGQEIVQTIALPPHKKSDVAVVGRGVVEDDTGNESIVKFPPYPLSVVNTALDITNKAAPEIFIGGDNIAKAPRLADLLLAWGIGPSYAPDPTRGPNTAEYNPEEWVTGPEAMAIALGIDLDPDMGGTDSEAVSIWKDSYNTITEDYLLDDGHLVIDNFVSYLNINGETPPRFTTGFGGDIPRGTGVPMALGVIDHARALPAIEQIGDPNPSSATGIELLQLALTRPTFGTININTAPVEVLRLLPGLSPSRATYRGPAAGPMADEWWGKDNELTELPVMIPADDTTNLDGLDQNPDVASAIVAYRDRTYGVPITAARPEPVGSGKFYESAPLNFEPTNPALFANNMRGEVLSGLFAGDLPVDRSTMTGIDGIRPTPGFGSLGELLAVRLDPEFKNGIPTSPERERWDMLSHLSIQQYGFDVDNMTGEEIASGIDGTTTIMSQIYSGGPVPTAGEIANDYAERISMANAVLNTLSVRSDFYAVWFVVHGYQESDVKNLRPSDPLVPSVKKRYLMVIDRSNVIEPGDKPKILVLKELPL